MGEFACSGRQILRAREYAALWHPRPSDPQDARAASIGRSRGGCELRHPLRAAFEKASRSGAGEVELRCQPRRMKRQGHATAGERRDDRGLISKPPGPTGRRFDVAIGDRRDSQRSLPAGRGACEPMIEKRTVGPQFGEQGIPLMSERGQMPAADHETKIGDPILDKFETGIAARKKGRAQRWIRARRDSVDRQGANAF